MRLPVGVPAVREFYVPKEVWPAASLARWIRSRAQPMLPQLDRIDLYETRGCGAILSWGDDGPALPL